jgi:hypothetical protein
MISGGRTLDTACHKNQRIAISPHCMPSTPPSRSPASISVVIDLSSTFIWKYITTGLYFHFGRTQPSPAAHTNTFRSLLVRKKPHAHLRDCTIHRGKIRRYKITNALKRAPRKDTRVERLVKTDQDRRERSHELPRHLSD